MKLKGLEIIKELFVRIRRRDFSGNTGLAMKNSMYSFGTTFVEKLGSLIFVIILARMLMPELFGLYSLALSTLLIFIGFADVGIKQAITFFLSKSLSKNNDIKTKSYLKYFFKLKIFLITAIIFVLLILSKFLSETYYQKPIFVALMVGVSFVFFRSFIGFFRSVFHAMNDFKKPFYWQIFFQVCRLIIVPLAVVLFLDSMINNPSNIFIVILALAIAWFLTLALILYFFSSIKFLKVKAKKLGFEERKEIKKFTFPLLAVTLSGIFFAYIDIFVLGKFVPSEFIGYYQAAFSIVGALASLLTFSTALFPIFSKLDKKGLEKALPRSVKMAVLIGIVGAIFTFIFAPLLIKIAFGSEYLASITIVRIFSILVLILPLNAVYVAYLTSLKKTPTIAKLLISTTIINIILNYTVASLLLSLGPLAIVLGICGTTILSKLIYLGGLVFSKRKQKNAR